MKNHKLFTLFAQLTAQEKRDIEKFLQAKVFNNRKLALLLFQFLLKQKGIPEKSAIFKALFPNEKYQDDKVRLCMSQLVKKIEAFLVYQYQQKEKITNAKILAKIYQNKTLRPESEKLLKNTLLLQDKQPIRNGQYYLDKYELTLDRFNNAIAVRTTEQNLQEVSDSLDTSFLILKLQQACYALSHQAVFQQKYQMGLLDVILPYIEQHQLTKIPAVGIYYYCYLALKGQAPATHFTSFKQLLFQYQTQFSNQEWSNLLLLGTNICIQLINKGDATYLKEIWGLYKKGLATQALLDNGVLSRFVYQNIVTSGMRVGELQWTRQFLLDYKDNVEKEFRESAFRFNMARLAYQEKNYEEAMDLLRDTDQADLLINLYAKNLLLKIYYELGEFKLLESFLDAFQIYLRRKKDIASHKKNYWNMIYYTQKLMKVNPFNTAAKDELKAKIEAEPVLLERPWLLEQLSKC